MERIDKILAIKEFAEAGYYITEGEYTSVDKPLTCIDLEGYLYYKTLRTVRQQQKNGRAYQHKFSIKNKYYWENIQHFMNTKVDSGTILLTQKDEFKNGNEKVSFQCGCCGRTFKAVFRAFTKLDNKMCPKCYQQKRLHADYIEKRRNDFSIYEEQAKLNGLKILSASILNYKDNIEVEDSDGYRGIISISRLMKGSSFKRYYKKNPYSIYNMQKFIKDNKADCILLTNKYVSNKQMVDLICSCGKHYQTSFSHFIYSKKFRCNDCSTKQSNIAKAVEEYLSMQNIKYTKEYIYADCKSARGKALQFDFYLMDYKSCIEVDGIQHFQLVMFGGTQEEASNRFKRIQENDKSKNLYCAEHRIPLLRIPYWNIENSEIYKNEIDDFISLIKSNELYK
jgi:very-short-patch-repair endonuclease